MSEAALASTIVVRSTEEVRLYESHDVLVAIPNPYLLAKMERTDILQLLIANPTEGADKLRHLARHIAADMQKAMEAGAAGILYVLGGASPQGSTPMEYGGHFLELDRQILSESPLGCFRILFVAGGEGTYFDFVSDLPAEVFAWDAAKTGVSSQEVRQMRQGPQASSDPGSEMDLPTDTLDVVSYLESQSIATTL